MNKKIIAAIAAAPAIAFAPLLAASWEVAHATPYIADCPPDVGGGPASEAVRQALCSDTGQAYVPGIAGNGPPQQQCNGNAVTTLCVGGNMAGIPVPPVCSQPACLPPPPCASPTNCGTIGVRG